MKPPIHKQRWYRGSTITIPGRAIHVDEQHGQPMVWYEADGLNRTYHLVMTGGNPPDDTEHVGSFLAEGGRFVGHLYADRT